MKSSSLDWMSARLLPIKLTSRLDDPVEWPSARMLHKTSLTALGQDSFQMPSALMKQRFAGVICWEVSAAVNVRTCSVKLTKWCDAATKAWHKIERYRDSTSYPYLILGAFHPHLTYSWNWKTTQGMFSLQDIISQPASGGSNLARWTHNIFTLCQFCQKQTEPGCFPSNFCICQLYLATFLDEILVEFSDSNGQRWKCKDEPLFWVTVYVCLCVRVCVCVCVGGGGC